MKTRVLSADGGGARALLTLQVLKYVEASTGKHCVDLFDHIVGTSTGGIIALALCRPTPMSAVEVEQFYLKWLPQIFANPWYQKFSTVFGLKTAKYSAATLEQALKATFGSELIGKKAMVFTTDMANNSVEGLTASYDLLAWQAARATSAAPTYFAPCMVEGFAAWDGGLAANHPALSALARFGVPLTDAWVLSLGTGAAKEGWSGKDVLGWQTLQQLSPIITVATDGGADETDLLASSFIPKGQYLRLQTYLANAAMDDVSPSNLAALQKAGQALVEQNKAAIDAWIAEASKP
jgi:patatin-like phospholipase/acyl hydrolase